MFNYVLLETGSFFLFSVLILVLAPCKLFYVLAKKLEMCSNMKMVLKTYLISHSHNH